MHLPEGTGVGSSESKVHLTNVFDGAAKHFTTARHEKGLDEAKAGTLNYFDMDTHNFETSRDPFGNVQKWMHDLSETLQSINAILGDSRWVSLKELGSAIISTR